MSAYAFARRSACVGFCVLALGVTVAAAQQVPAETSADKPADASQSAPTGTENVTPAETPASTAPTSDLPELVVNDDGKKKKKVVKTKQEPVSAPSTSGDAATATEPPPGVTLGTGAPSDTGTTTFDASAVKARTDGSGDANSFMRNLPNIQYQNYGSNKGGASSTSSIDTRPELLSISGARTYENNFIVNGVSVSNITGTANTLTPLGDRTFPNVTTTDLYGTSPQNIYVPTDFIGEATVVDSNASAEYGQFQGGVVIYDLVAPPTDRYHASVSASRDSSDWANYILATPDRNNPNRRLPPSYEKTNLSASVGAPLTPDFAFILQASRQEAESSKQFYPWVSNGFADESSDNIFLRFAATAKTDIGKFTFDVGRTDYTQNWVYATGPDIGFDMTTESTTSKLQLDSKLDGMRVDAVGLGNVKLMSRAFYNVSETMNSDDNDYFLNWYKTSSSGYPNWCIWQGSGTTSCYEGGFSNKLQGQTDYGVQSQLSGDLLLGNFKLGTELKHYIGENARLRDYYYATNGAAEPQGNWDCVNTNGRPESVFCTPSIYITAYRVYPKRDVIAELNAAHTFAELDQTWGWFNVRAGVRHDYDDYFKNNNFAPRLVGTIKPFDGLSFTGGYNRYYLGETLYYALRDKVGGVQTWTRAALPAGSTGTPAAFTNTTTAARTGFRYADLATPYDDEVTGAVGIRDPLLGGQVRLKYLERRGHDQFAIGTSNSCGTGCTATTNDGDTYYRSYSAEYTKEWNRLSNPFQLNAVAITGNVTKSEQHNSKNNYLQASDLDSDGSAETGIYYNGHKYTTLEFQSKLTGNLDIPVRFGATLATRWFDNLLELNATAGVNLGFQGVSTAAMSQYVGATPEGTCLPCNRYEDRVFRPSLKLDVSGQINVTEQASIQFSGSNITNSTQQTTTIYDSPWLLGRSYYLGSALRF